jgi:hypothetical protein
VLGHNLEAITRVKVLSALALAENDLYYFSRYLLDNSMLYLLSPEIYFWIQYTQTYTHQASVRIYSVEACDLLSFHFFLTFKVLDQCQNNSKGTTYQNVKKNLSLDASIIKCMVASVVFNSRCQNYYKKTTKIKQFSNFG